MPDEFATARTEVHSRYTRGSNADVPRADVLGEQHSDSPVKPQRRKLADNDEAMSDAVTSPDIMDTLSAEERSDIAENAPAVRTALVKAIMARAEPGRIVMAHDDDDDLEPTAMRAVRTLDDKLVEKLAPRIDTVLRNDAKAMRMFGVHASTNMREPMKIRRLKHKPRPKIVVPMPENRDDEQRASQNATYTRALVELRAVHCLRITEPRDNPDEMVLGTILVGASGNVNAGRSMELGEFHNGDVFSYGELPIGQFSLRSTDGYPKHMYVLFKLVETDSDGRETARDLTKAIGGFASTIATIYAGPAAGATAGMLVSVIGEFFQGLIDEDEFPIVGKRLTLDNMHSLGGSVGPKERTGDIGGHGGKYRIGYRWLMGA